MVGSKTLTRSYTTPTAGTVPGRRRVPPGGRVPARARGRAGAPAAEPVRDRAAGARAGGGTPGGLAGQDLPGLVEKPTRNAVDIPIWNDLFWKFV